MDGFLIAILGIIIMLMVNDTIGTLLIIVGVVIVLLPYVQRIVHK